MKEEIGCRSPRILRSDAKYAKLFVESVEQAISRASRELGPEAAPSSARRACRSRRAIWRLRIERLFSAGSGNTRSERRDRHLLRRNSLTRALDARQHNPDTPVLHVEIAFKVTKTPTRRCARTGFGKPDQRDKASNARGGEAESIGGNQALEPPSTSTRADGKDDGIARAVLLQRRQPLPIPTSTPRSTRSYRLVSLKRSPEDSWRSWAEAEARQVTPEYRHCGGNWARCSL